MIDLHPILHMYNIHDSFVVADLEEASSTPSLPCDPEVICRDAYIQNLVGCDAATRRCVCEKGYVLSPQGICTGKCF